MQEQLKEIQRDLQAVVAELEQAAYLKKDTMFVVGCSTSEVAGQHIGTAGSEDIAAVLFSGLKDLQKKTGIHLAFQCCEHLNRALVVERETAEKYHLEEVSVVPVPKAGGSMASFAYKHMEAPVVVEHIKAHAGIDIGETMIGMHLKHVAVPIRLKQRYIGSARVNTAKTRPKLIGGVRAVYDVVNDTNSCT
ncbi:TIGR01440 family protein [Ornithinibacillus sp. 179-J 7C1 HS]|uniref:TIGR01440 family protein n=1 Tax=Ornithinibacillus sp. 179-J 7C1 HS TaxID=3142384 RepID=UPI00399FF7CD